MVQFRPKARELIGKVVYYGPPLGGKTTNLRSIFAGYPPDTRGELIVVPTGSDRTIFFDFLPVDLGTLRGMRVRVQLYTVPGQVRYNATRQVVLRGVDGVVFVADSQRALMRNNKESWENLKDNLILQGLKLAEMPHVVQYNKRDLKDIASIEELDESLNEYNAPFYEAVATTGIGVEETLQGMVKLVIRSLRERFQLDGEQALTQPVHMGLHGGHERELEPHFPVRPDDLPSAEEMPGAGPPEVTLVNYQPGEGGAPPDPFKTQRIFTLPPEPEEPDPGQQLEPSPSQADEPVGDRTIFEEATHPDLEAQVARMQMERAEATGAGPLGEAAPPDEEPSATEGQREPEAVAFGETASAEPVAGERSVPGPVADQDPFAVTGDVPPLTEQDLQAPPPAVASAEAEAAADEAAISETATPEPPAFGPAFDEGATELPEAALAPTELPAAPPDDERLLAAGDDAIAPGPLGDDLGEPAVVEGESEEAAPTFDEPAVAAVVEEFVFGGPVESGPPLEVAPLVADAADAFASSDEPFAASGYAAPADEVTAFEPEFAPGPDDLAPPSVSDAAEVGDDLAVDVTGASAEPFEQQPSPVVEAAAEPEEPADEEQIGLEAAVAAVRAHGDEAVRDREIRDELEGLTSRESGAEEAVVTVEPVEAFGIGVAGPAATIDIADQSVVQVAGEPFLQAAEAQESPFQAPRQADAPPPVDVVEDVFAITPAPPREVVREPETVVVPVEISAVRRAAGRALAQVGEVRELELEVPVPSGWTGGRRMTLQLRLTLVPQEEGHER